MHSMIETVPVKPGAVHSRPNTTPADRAILALDLGTATGWALRATGGQIVSSTVSFRPSRYDGGGMRCLRFRSWLDQMATDVDGLTAIYSRKSAALKRLGFQGSRSCSSRRNLLLDLSAHGSVSDVEIMARLEVDPELRRCPKISSEPHRRIDRDAPATEHDIIDARTRRLDRIGKLIDADPHRRQELVTQDFTGMDRRQPTPGCDVREINPPIVNVLAPDGHGLAPQWKSTISTSQLSPSCHTKQNRH
jgi:hypothetical protein